MSEQSLDLKSSARIVRRHIIAVGVMLAVGLGGGLSYAIVNPAQYVATAYLELPANANSPTQAVIAGSQTVLANAGLRLDLAKSAQALHSLVSVTSLTPGVLSVQAEGKTAAEAEGLANAVARSYVAYAAKSVTAATVQATVLAPANTATQGSRVLRWLLDALLGALAGAVVGAIVVLAVGRRDRRLRERDEMANALGLPVVASLPAWHARDARGWARLLDTFQPSAVYAWQVGNTLRYLGLDRARSASPAEPSRSLTVVSLRSDPRALAVGPQIAVLAAAEGIRTALVIGPQQDTNATASLRAACSARMRAVSSSSSLQVVVADNGKSEDWAGIELPGAMLTVVVAVVDGARPAVVNRVATTASVLAVSPGAATAEELARVAASEAANGRQIDGIVVSDPDPADKTTGRVPQSMRPRQDGRPPGPTRARTAQAADHAKSYRYQR